MKDNAIRPVHRDGASTPGILFVYDSLRIGGCERVISVLAREFSQRNFAVTILMIKKNKVEFELPDSVKVLSFEDFPKRACISPERVLMWGKLTWSKLTCALAVLFRRKNQECFLTKDARMEMYRLYVRYCGFMRQCFRQHPDDTIISFMDNPNFATILASRGLPNRVIISERNHPGRDNVQPHILRYRNRLYSRADRIVFQTAEERDYYPEDIRRKGVLIENPISEHLPEPYWGERTKEIVTFCRLDRQKNLIGLIRSFCRIKERYIGYDLVIYGKGNQEELIRRYIEENNLSERVFLRPYDENVHRQVLDAAMFVSFSNYEGISNSMLEAMAIALPVICTDCPAGGAKLMIESGTNGLLVPVGDEEAMANAMAYCIDHPEIARAMGRKAAEIRNRYNVAEIASQWIKVVLNGSS